MILCATSSGLQVIMFEMLAEVAFPIRESVSFALLNSFSEFFSTVAVRMTLISLFGRFKDYRNLIFMQVFFMFLLLMGMLLFKYGGDTMELNRLKIDK